MYKKKKIDKDSNKEGKHETNKKSNINGYCTIFSRWLWKYDEYAY